jgi:hypothetical protein
MTMLFSRKYGLFSTYSIFVTGRKWVLLANARTGESGDEIAAYKIQRAVRFTMSRFHKARRAFGRLAQTF